MSTSFSQIIGRQPILKNGDVVGSGVNWKMSGMLYVRMYHCGMDVNMFV